MTIEEAIWILANLDKDGNLTGMVGGYKEALDIALEALKQPEIRCKDCENFQTDWKPQDSDGYYCAIMDRVMEEDGFCSYAERRKDDY